MSDVPREPDRRIFDYGTYQDYISAQRKRALRTRPQTRRYAWHRARVAEQLHGLCPAAKTMLCIGARSDVEVIDFENHGFKAEGIDLYPTERIIKCDMSKIDRHGAFAGRTFDVFAAIHSIEHCLNFDGFLRCLKMCQQAFACVTPQIAAPNAWDCSAFRFAHPDAGVEEIEKAFPGFSVGWREVHRSTLMFVATRSQIDDGAANHGIS